MIIVPNANDAWYTESDDMIDWGVWIASIFLFLKFKRKFLKS